MTSVLAILLSGCGGTSNSATTSVSPTVASSVSPAAINFGPQLTNTPAVPSSVVYQNIGSVPLAISSIRTSGDYAQSNDCGNSLAISASCNISVTFTPGATGNRSGSLQISGDSPQNVSLSGMGANMHNVSLSWDPSPSAVLGYHIYAGTQPGGPYNLLNPSPEPLTNFQSSVLGGQNWYFVVSAVNVALIESLPSNEAIAAIQP